MTSGTFLLGTVKDSATFSRRLIRALGFASAFFMTGFALCRRHFKSNPEFD